MFQKLSWAAQLAAGATLFGISFWLEGEVLTAFLGHTWLAFALTGALEASKALTIVLYRIMKTQQLVSYPAAVRSLVLSFRVALLLLSAACSVMYLANMLDRPQLEAVRAEDLRHLEQEHIARRPICGRNTKPGGQRPRAASVSAIVAWSRRPRSAICQPSGHSRRA